MVSRGLAFIFLKHITNEMNLLKGTHILPKSTEDFYKVCSDLGTAFGGAIRLFNNFEGKLYQADLLIDNGFIIAASVKNLNDNITIYGEDAIREIKEKLGGSQGNLDIYSFTQEDMKIAIDDNPESVLESKISLHNLEIKIAPKYKKKSPLDSIIGVFRGLTQIGRKPSISMTKHIPTISGTTAVQGVKKAIEVIAPEKKSTASIQLPFLAIPDIKKERLEELKKRQLEKISKVVIEKKDETIARKIADGEKIETSIDELFEIVQAHGRVKINDAIAKRLNTTKAQIEEWAMILEEHNLLELHYPTIGEPEIRIIKKS